MDSNDGSPSAEPYNVWADGKSTPSPPPAYGEDHDLDMEELIRIEEAAGGVPSAVNGGRGGSPTRYSAQTIRQKKGRQLVSSMTSNLSSSSSLWSSQDHERESEPKNTAAADNETVTTTTTTTAATGTTGGATQGTKTSSTSTRSFGGNGFPSVGLYQGLGRLQAVSAMAFGTFGFIHLIPPMLATVGGIDLANKALLWGRVYYQTYGIEQVLVYGSLAVHIGTGLGRAIVRFIWKAKAYYASTRQVAASDGTATTTTTKTTTTTTTTTISGSDGTSKSSSESSTSTSSPALSRGGSGSTPGLFPYHRLVGWLLTPLVLSHMRTMRQIPVEVFGDSSMIDYGFVTFLHRMKRPAPYVLLVGFMAYHMFGGGPVAFNMALPKGSSQRIKVQELKESKKARAVVTAVVSTAALVGVYRILTSDVVIPMSKFYLQLLNRK
ncbi:hypothetical protein EDD21DRAFT_387480 [Dissophora ornata]|nr:hypothetical protein BGZ58_007345 [Dissophora ornata]KAI8596697.1 hypothetical protein EDD21DRAFT_387480 [Dissophora ornata]